jgi:ABC-type nitrate/sulfonate/bicarbonate transport system substrate-binding protein
MEGKAVKLRVLVGTTRTPSDGASKLQLWRRAVGAVFVSILVAACGGQAAAPQSTPLQQLPLTVVTGGIDVVWAPFYFAQQRGYFTKYGVDLTMRNAGSNITQVVASGQADIALNNSVLAPAKSGIDTVAIHTLVSGLVNEYVVGLPKVKTINDCSRLGVFPPPGATYAIAVINKQVFSASYTIVPLDVNVQIASLASGSIDCLLASGSFVQPAITSGTAHLVVDGSDKAIRSNTKLTDAISAQGGIWGIRSNLQGKREAVVRFLKAVHQALTDMLKMSPDKVLAVIRQSPDFAPVDLTALTQGYNIDKEFWFPNNGYISAAQWPNVLNLYIASGSTYIDPTNATWQYAQRVDMSYYESAFGKPKS